MNDENILSVEFPLEVVQLGILAGEKLIEHILMGQVEELKDFENNSDKVREYYKSLDVTLPTMLDGFEDFTDDEKTAFAVHFYECTKEYNEEFSR